MRFVVIFIFYFLFVTGLSATPKEIRVVSDDSYPPYIFRDENKQLQGILVDYWALWEKKTGVKVLLDAMDWVDAKRMMAEGKADVIDTIFKTDERMKIYDFSTAYAELEVPVFFHKNISGITSITSLKGFLVAVKEGDACIDVLKKAGIETIKEYSSYEKIVKDATEKKIHVFCADKPPALYYLYKMQAEDEFRYSMNLYTGYFHRAVKKGDTELLMLIEKGFKDISKEEYQKINEKWMGQKVGNNYFQKYILYSFAAAGFFLLIIFLYVVILRKAVRIKTFEVTKTVQQLRKSEYHLSTLLGALPDIYFLIDNEGVIIEYHAPNDSILAIPPEQFLNKNLSEIALPFEVVQNFRLSVKKVIKEKTLLLYEYSLNVPIGRRTFEGRFLPYDATTALVLCRDITEQKNAESVIKDSKELYELIIENLNDGFFDWNIKEDSFYFSPHWHDILGNSFDEWRQRIHPEDRNRVFGMIDDHLKGRLPMVFIEYRIVVSDSAVRWVLTRSRIVKYDNRGRPLRMIGTVADITESKRMEGALLESEERFRELADMLPQTIYECDKNGRVTYVNKSGYERFGYSTADIEKGISVIEVLEPKDRSRAVQNIENVMKGAQTTANEYTAVDARGHRFPVAIYSVPVIRNGELAGMRGIIIDITDRILQETKLKNTKDFLKTIINAVQSAIIATDMDGNITEMNSAAEVLMLSHITKQKSQPSDLWQTFPCLIQFKNEFKRVVSEKTTEISTCIYTENNSKHYYRISMYPLVFEGVPGVVVRIDDITEFEIKDEQLRQSQKMETIGTLAGGLAHDFNNQLGGIIGSISLINLMLKHDIEREKLEKYVQIIDESARRASEMVQHLLALSRKNDPSFAVVDLNKIAEHVMKICSTTFDKSIDLKIKVYEDEALVMADHSQIEQVMLNLCVNALHAMTIMRTKDGIGGEMLIAVEKSTPADSLIRIEENAEYFQVIVKDTGVGIPDSIKDKIFDPFFTTKKRDAGTGLGLTMVYSIITQHKGFITFDSTENVGTTVTIQLPAASKNAVVTPIKTHHVKKGVGTILVVDDELVMRQTAQSMLEECGYTAYIADSGEAAIDLFTQKRSEIDAIILDLSMPKMSGKETFEKLKAIDANILVIMVSGYKKDVRVDQSIALGVAGFLQKPFSIETLSDKIDEVLRVRKE